MLVTSRLRLLGVLGALVLLTPSSVYAQLWTRLPVTGIVATRAAA